MGTNSLRLIASAALIAPLHAQTSYGTGSPGAGGVVPTLSSNQPWLGNTGFTLSVDQAVGGSFGFVLLSTGPTAGFVGTIPLWIDLAQQFASLSFITDGAPGAPGAGSGSAGLPIALAPDPLLAGIPFYAQALLADFATGSPAVTAGLEMVLTLPPEIAVGVALNTADDPLFRIDALSQTLSWQESSSDSDGTSGLAYVGGGKYLYQSSYATNTLRRLDLTGVTPVWSDVATFSVSPVDLAYDESRGRMWTLAGSSSSARELVAFDVDSSSPTHHTQVASTSGLTSMLGLAEVWGLSADGSMAAISQVLGDMIHLVDLDPASPTYLQVVQTAVFQTSVSSPIHITTSLAFTADGSQLYALVQHAGQEPSELGRYLIAADTWLDHNPFNPGIDNLGVNSTPALAFPSAGVDLSVPPTGDRVLVVGFPGWAGRVDFSPSVGWSYTPVTQIAFGETWQSGLDPTGETLAISDEDGFVHLVDVDSMSPLGTITLPPGATNLHQLAWR